MRAIVVALLLLPLAGCSQPLQAALDGASFSGHASGNATAAAAKVPFLNVSVLHLNAAPALNLSVPSGSVPVAMALPPLSAAQGFAFNRTIQRVSGNLTQATTLLWLRMTQTVLQPGPGTDPGCSAVLTITLVHNGTAAAYNGGCGSAGLGAIPPGDHAIAFGSAPASLPPGLVVRPGDDLILTFTFYFVPPGSGVAVYLLAGSADRDSWVRLDGLREPLKLAPSGNATAAPKV